MRKPSLAPHYSQEKVKLPTSAFTVFYPLAPEDLPAFPIFPPPQPPRAQRSRPQGLIMPGSVWPPPLTLLFPPPILLFQHPFLVSKCLLPGLLLCANPQEAWTISLQPTPTQVFHLSCQQKKKKRVKKAPTKPRIPPKVKAARMRAMAQQIELQHERLWADSKRNLLTIRAQPLK